MADKTYKFVSVCERPMPVQTNNAYQFTWHVAFCKTCLEKLPESILKQLEPRLSQFKSERAEKKLPTEQKPPIEVISPETLKKGMEKGIKVKDEPPPPTPKADKQQQSQFDGILKDSPVFQGLAKSVEEVKTEITGQINALGDMMQTRMEQVFKGISGKETVEETKEELPLDQTPLPKIAPGTGAPSGGAEGGGRANPFGQPDQLPAAMQKGYKAGEKPPPQVPPLDTPPGGEQSPFIGGQKPPLDTTGGKELPRLESQEHIDTFKEYLAGEERRLAGGGKVVSKTAIVEDIRESADSWLNIVEKAVNIIKGKSTASEGETPKGEAGQLIEGMKIVSNIYGSARKITMDEQNAQQKNFNDMYKNTLDTIKLGLGMEPPMTKQTGAGGTESGEEQRTRESPS